MKEMQSRLAYEFLVQQFDKKNIILIGVSNVRET